MSVYDEQKAYHLGKWLFDACVHGPEATYDNRIFLKKLADNGILVTPDTLGEAIQGFQDARDAFYRALSHRPTARKCVRCEKTLDWMVPPRTLVCRECLNTRPTQESRRPSGFFEKLVWAIFHQ